MPSNSSTFGGVNSPPKAVGNTPDQNSGSVVPDQSTMSLKAALPPLAYSSSWVNVAAVKSRSAPKSSRHEPTPPSNPS